MELIFKLYHAVGVTVALPTVDGGSTGERIMKMTNEMQQEKKDLNKQAKAFFKKLVGANFQY